MRSDPNAKLEHIGTLLNNLAESTSAESSSFWENRTRAFVMVMLQDREAQVKTFVESCQSALALVYSSVFPLNEAPPGLGALMHKFRDGAAIKGFMREQLVAGATTALARARAHYPQLDLEAIG
jgi:hypothetical protein